MAFEQRTGPMEGIRVLDLGQSMASWTATMILGDLGADVIRIEPRQGGAKGIHKLVIGYAVDGVEMRIVHLNRNKRSLTLDLKAPAGKEVFVDLVKKSDVVLNNYRYGVMSRLGLDYERLKQENPRIIYCSITGFGNTGPYRDRPAIDQIGQAISGLIGITREPGKREPGKLPNLYGISLADYGTGLYAVQGIMAALYVREKSGLGQMVDLSLLDCCLALLNYEGTYYLNSGILREPHDSKVWGFPLVGIFETSDDCVMICVVSERHWQSFCKAVGRDDLSQDPRFATAAGRLEHRAELNAVAEEIVRTRTTDAWLELLMKEDIPVSPVNTLDKVFSDPQVQQGDMVNAVQYQGKQYKLVGNPIKMSGTQHQEYDPPPTLGQHTDEILSELLGYSRQKIEELRPVV